MLRLPDVCILSPRQINLKRISEKDQENFSERCVLPTKTQGKLLIEFSAGHGFLVDPVAIQVGLSPNRPVFAGVFPFKIGDCMGEFVNERI